MYENNYWSLPQEEFLNLNNHIWSSSFACYDPPGIFTHRHQKLLLSFLLFDLSEYRMSSALQERDGDICTPEYHSTRLVAYKYKDFANLCGFKTIKTLKKYLQSLVDIEVLAPFHHPIDESMFFATVDWVKIINSNKIEGCFK